MCFYVTERTAVVGSGKGPDGWFRVTQASVYLDHPYHAPLDHSLNIDFLNPDAGPSARLAIELDPNSARELVRCIERSLQDSPAVARGD